MGATPGAYHVPYTGRWVDHDARHLPVGRHDHCTVIPQEEGKRVVACAHAHKHVGIFPRESRGSRMDSVGGSLKHAGLECGRRCIRVDHHRIGLGRLDNGLALHLE